MAARGKSKASEPIGAQQKRVIWSIAKKALKMDGDALYAVILRMFEKEHMSDLSNAEAELLIAELKRLDAGLAFDALTVPQYRKIMGMAAEFGWSARGISQYLEKEVGVSDPKWLNVRQARVAITGLEKIRAWKENHPEEAAADGVQ